MVIPSQQISAEPHRSRPQCRNVFGSGASTVTATAAGVGDVIEGEGVDGEQATASAASQAEPQIDRRVTAKR
ncbi:MAG: hypothetical protein AAGA56_05110 [Myxococcota bacterium]